MVARMLAVGGIVVVLFSDAGGVPSASKTSVTIWAATPATAAAFGGAAYGGVVPTTGAMISEQRDVEVAANGDVRIAGVASTADPASVQLRDLTEPGASITEQRFVPGATTPTEIIARHVGEPVTVVTTKGDVSGVLRAVDEHSVVVEIGTGDQRRVSVMRRDGYVLDVRLSGGTGDKPGLAWRLATKRPGKHSIELAYRAEGMSWSADYLAVLDETSKQIDFSAWATIKNATGVTFDQAELTLVTGGTSVGPAIANPAGTTLLRPSPVPVRYTLPNLVHLGAGDSVQVELVPPRVAAKTRSVIAYEAMSDPSPQYQNYPNVDCTVFNGTGMGTGRAEIAVELDLPSPTPLPEGRVRLFRRHGARLEVVSEDQLRSAAGLARIRLSPDTDITGERKAITCNVDERAHTVHEKIEVKVSNKSTQVADIAIREFMWRWPVWRLDSEDKKGVRAGQQTQEYRVRIPAKGSQTVTYTVVYTW